MLVSYRVSFPGPVGRVNGQLAATVVVVDDSRSKQALESRLEAQVVKYLRAVGASNSRSIACPLFLLDSYEEGRGSIMAGPSGTQQVRIGQFTLERMGDAATTG